MIVKNVRKTIEDYHMITPREKVLAGVSGGADSVALLIVLHELSKEMDFDLEVVHIDHQIRGEESSGDADFVIKLAHSLGVNCHMIRVDVPAFCQEAGVGTEEGARLLRYQKFAETAKQEGAKIALAHHMEDNAETILFQLTRGSSLTGLCGMQPMRQDENGVCYIRPFLFTERRKIEDFLRFRNQGFREDSTNAQLCYSRNYVRKKVLPELCQLNPQAVAHINSAAEKLSDIRDFLEEETKKAWEQVVEVCNGELVLDVPKLQMFHKTLQKEIVYKFVSEILGGKKDITTKHVENVFALCEGQSGHYMTLPKEIVIRREFDKLCVYKGEDAVCKQKYIIPEDMMRDFPNSEGTLRIPLQEGKAVLSVRRVLQEEITDEIPRKACTKWMDYDKIKEGFCIRTRESGDYIMNDAFGHHKKLKQYFIDEKIPASKRDKTWLLTQGQHVLWVVGGRISEAVKVTKDTKTILEITYEEE